MLLYNCISHLLSSCWWQSSKWAEWGWFDRYVECWWLERAARQNRVKSEASNDAAKFSLPQRSFSPSCWSCLSAVFLPSEMWLSPSFCESHGFICWPLEKGVRKCGVCVTCLGLVSTMLVLWQQLGDKDWKHVFPPRVLSFISQATEIIPVRWLHFKLQWDPELMI